MLMRDQTQEATATISSQRFLGMLHAAMGSSILGALNDPKVVEVMANADGRVWVDRAGEGRSCIGSIELHRAESVIRLVAGQMAEAVGPHRPLLSGTLPYTGQRFQGQLPPITAAPVFCIRKRAEVIFTLDNYVAQGVMTAAQAHHLREAVAQRHNILIVGGTGSGKTTLANAVLAEPSFARDRVVLIEDTRELQCASPDRVELLTKSTDPTVTMDDLVKCALRLRPDRIIVGEVRGAEALALLKAWNTGHPGGLATLHANSGEDALSRLEDLVGEVARHIPRRAIARTIHLIVFVRRTARGRNTESLSRITGLKAGRYCIESIAPGRAQTLGQC